MKKPLTKLLTKTELEELYISQGKSLQDIAEIFHCTRQAVKWIMEQKGIERRKKSAARVMAIRQGKFDAFEYDTINDDFFGNWSPAMAWVLGLLFTDGNVQRSKKGLRVSISSIDYDLLEQVKNLLGSKRAVSKRNQSYDKSKHIYIFEFYREKMRDDLHSLGLLERKSLTMQFPSVPQQLMRHFVRGCWDGDGSVFISAGKLRASYVCGSPDFTQCLVNELYKAGIYRSRLRGYMDNRPDFSELTATYPAGQYPLKIHVEKRSKAPSYSIKIDSQDNLKKLFHYLYAGIDSSLYLKRKFDVFITGLSLSEQDISELSKINDKPDRPEIYPPIRQEQPMATRSEIKVVEQSIERIMTINNADGKLKCDLCSEIHDKMYVTAKTYCPNCFAALGLSGKR